MTTVPHYCARCGRPMMFNNVGHLPCTLDLEPPRYCVSCGRRMKVQVLPDGWRAECREHGVLTSTPS
jgi:hypothetical protein